MSVASWHATPAQAQQTFQNGEDIYTFYCYQCHGYSGNARTLASTYLDPTPRDFTAADPVQLNRESMIDAVTRGRPGTAMVGFRTVLAGSDIDAVVDYVRETFMHGTPPQAAYHTAKNGWDRHDRYQAAYPFVNNEIPLDTPWDALTDAQRMGKRLYLKACISCHDHGPKPDQGPIWELYTVTYPHHEEETGQPQENYDEKYADEYSRFLPYSVHRQAPGAIGPEGAETRGRQLYEDNCAFCHAGDGSGRNWIGSFLQPRPTDLRGARHAGIDHAELGSIIENGVPGTSMPAWRNVLTDREINDIVHYITNVLSVTDSDQPANLYSTPRPSSAIGWIRRKPRKTPGAGVQ